VVAKNEQEDRVLDTLLERGRNNGVALEVVTAAEAREIEPAVKTWQRALYSPDTSVVDPAEVTSVLMDEAVAKGVRFEFDTGYRTMKGDSVVSTRGNINAGYVVNAAGLYADKVARDFGFSHNYYMLPFKGVYLYAKKGTSPLRTNIYPVPDLRNPFLGVHFTLSVSGRVKIGPTAMPAFWPEQYGWFKGFGLKRFLRTSGRHLRLMFAGDPIFRELAIEEIRKYSRAYLVSQAERMAEGVRVQDYTEWGRPGIRAQLFDKSKGRLEMDFVIEGDAKSMHVLNAVSPAFTCSLPFTRFVVERIQQNLS
jgi:L-2-hydroxyglutarate oxidase LhgO